MFTYSLSPLNTIYATPSYTSTSTSDPNALGTSVAGGTPTGSSSSTGFLQNKGAVAGTFTVVGLAAVAAISILAFSLYKRYRRRQDNEEVDEYFDKLPSLGQHNLENSRASPELIPPSTFNHSYATRDGYHRSGDPFNAPRPTHGLDFPPEMTSFGESRPPSFAPGTAYAAAMAQEGPYQYTGRSAHGHNDGTTAIGAALIAPSRSTNTPRAAERRPYDAAYAYDPFNSHH